MSLFSLKPDPVVGIDISSTAVKLLELSRTAKGLQVENYAMEYLPEKSVVDKKIEELESVGSVINQVVKRAKPRSQYAAIAVAGPTVITKTISMEGDLSDEDMKGQIESDPAQYLGQYSDDIDFDFQTIGPNEKEEDRLDVLLAASRRETIEARVAALELGGLKAKIVDIEKYALENAIIKIAENDEDIDDGDTVALIEIGATTSSLNVLGEKNGIPTIVFAHEEMFGGQQLTEEIQNRYDLSYEEANFAKRNNTLDPDFFMTVLDPFKDEMVQQISRMLQFYHNQSNYGKLSHILIAGGCASIPGIIDKVRNKVGGQVKIVNPFVSMSFSSRIKNKKALISDAPALMIAYGLALRSFDEY
jgi:type IV pilus assembly protein PilM